MLVFRPLSLIEEYDEKSLSFTFEDDIDYDDEASDEPEKNGELCKFFLKGNCNREHCDFRHTRGEKAVVCKHWLRGLCKKDKLCEFLHEYDMSKMPICHFYSNYGTCSNEECPYRHVNADEQQTDCAWYARGFCKHGPKCRHRHVKKEACIRYLTGFCPKGPDCEFGHPKFEIPEESLDNKSKHKWTCKFCNQPGHRDFECKLVRKDPMNIDHPQMRNREPREGMETNVQNSHKRPLSEVVCYKCNEKGHYANKCQNPRAGPNSHHPNIHQNFQQQHQFQPNRNFPQKTF